MRIAIRLDDIAPDMNWDNFWKMKKILDDAKIRPLVGVIPDNRDSLISMGPPQDNFFEIVRKLQKEGWIISQHGYQHVYETSDKGVLKINPFSEFAGLPYEKQLNKIKKGRENLEKQGIETDIFMAPGHTFDKNTLRALKECGFSYITDGYYSQNYKYKGLTFLPCKNTCSGKGLDTLCIHTNSMQENDFTKLEEEIRTHRERYMDFSVLMREPAVKKNAKVILAERMEIDRFLMKRYIGQSEGAKKYFAAAEHKNRYICLIKRVVFLPYLLILLIFAERKQKDTI